MSTLKTTNLQAPSAASPAIVLAADGSATAQLSSLNGGALSGARNRIINGGMAIDGRNSGAAQTIPNGGAARTYTVDRWAAYSFNAAINGQRVQGATAGQYRYQLSGAAGCTAIEFAQRIEHLNSTDLAGTTVTLSADFANSLLTTVNWYAFYANTTDNFSARTSFASGTFAVNSTVTRYSTNISVPAAATTGIEIVFTVGAQTSGTWTIGNVQLEPGTVATPFERRNFGQELALCQRYYQIAYNGQYRRYIANIDRDQRNFVVQMRATPTLTKTFGSSSGLNADGSIATTDYSYKIDFQYLGAGTGVVDISSMTFVASAEL
jgi:hypothetical protein